MTREIRTTMESVSKQTDYGISCEVAIIGAGPAGMAAALELRRLGIDACLVSDGPPGGLVHAARRLDNIPGHPDGISGAAWVRNCQIQTEKLDLKTINARATGIFHKNPEFVIATTSKNIYSKSVIIATGTRPVPLPPEIADSARVMRDVTGLPQNMIGMVVAVIGAGEAAVDSAMNVRDRGADVTIYARGDHLNICSAIQKELMATDIAVAVGARILSVQDRGTCARIRFDSHMEWVGDAVVVAIGRESRRDEISLASINSDSGTQVDSIIDSGALARVCTRFIGIFTAGDMNRDQDRYIVSAMADGQQAALKAYRHIRNQEK